MSTTAKDLLDYSAAALAPVTAIATIYIGYRQYRLEKQKLDLEERRFRHENYDKRLALFHSTMQLLSHIIEKGNAEDANLYKFLADTHESEFLCGKEMQDYLWQLYKQGVVLGGVREELENRNLPEAERSKLCEKKMELRLWFGNQLEVVREKFGRHLRLDDKSHA